MRGVLVLVPHARSPSQECVPWERRRVRGRTRLGLVPPFSLPFSVRPRRLSPLLNSRHRCISPSRPDKRGRELPTSRRADLSYRGSTLWAFAVWVAAVVVVAVSSAAWVLYQGSQTTHVCTPCAHIALRSTACISLSCRHSKSSYDLEYHDRSRSMWAAEVAVVRSTYSTRSEL